MSGIAAMIQAGAPEQRSALNIIIGNNDDSPTAPDEMTQDFATFIPMPQGEPSGLTTNQAALIIRALTNSIVDRNYAVLVGLQPDIEELHEDVLRIESWKAKLRKQPPEKIHLALAADAGGFERKSVAECLQRDSLNAIERSNKILRVLHLEKTFSPARAKVMDGLEDVTKRNMQKIRRILKETLATLHMRLPPGAEFGLKPLRDVKLYNGVPILFYAKPPSEQDEVGKVKGEWFVAQYDHPIVMTRGTHWNKWTRNWAKRDSGMVTIKVPPVGRGLLNEITSEYGKALIQFLRSDVIRSGEVQMRSPVLKQIHNYRLLRKVFNFKGSITHHFEDEEIDCHGDPRFGQLPKYDPRGCLQLEFMSLMVSQFRGRDRTVPGVDGSTMTVKIVDFMEKIF